MLTLLLAVGHNGAIGADGQIPWHIPADMRHFKSYTMGKPVIMGRKTAESIGRALPKRTNLVLSRSRVVPYPGQIPLVDVEEALDYIKAHSEIEEFIVAGGAQIYHAFWPHADRLVITHVDTPAPGADIVFRPEGVLTMRNGWQIPGWTNYESVYLEPSEYDRVVSPEGGRDLTVVRYYCHSSAFEG